MFSSSVEAMDIATEEIAFKLQVGDLDVSTQVSKITLPMRFTARI